MMNSLFLDTSYSVALAITNDANHLNARVIAEQIKTSRVQIVTTQAIILEIGNTFSKKRYRKTAVGIIDRFQSDPNTLIISLSDKLYEKGLELFRSRSDKDWGLIDLFRSSSCRSAESRTP